MNGLIAILKTLGLGGIAGGIVAFVFGKDKTDKTYCEEARKEINKRFEDDNKRFNRGEVQFAKIEKDLEYIREGIDKLNGK